MRVRGSNGIVLDVRLWVVREDDGTPERRDSAVDVALEGRRNPSSASAGSRRPGAGLLSLLVAGHVRAFQGYAFTKWPPFPEG